MQTVNLKLPIRHYQIARVYGPAMPTSGREGLQDKPFDKPVGQVGLVLVHCWNLGEPTGPYPIDDNARCPGEAANWVPTARQIIADQIRPVLDAARRIGMKVFHLAQQTYADRYESYRQIKADRQLAPPAGHIAHDGCVRPRSIEEQVADQYGPDFPGCVWQTHADSFDIAKALRPIDGEYVFLDGWQLNGLCRRLDIDTLFYAGFMADICLTNIPGAIREMVRKFGYRCVVLRQCTTAYEYADTHEGAWMTRAAIRLIEADLGYSASAADFLHAAADIEQAADGEP